MRVFVSCVLALGLTMFPAVAGAGDGNPAAGNASAASTVSNKPADAPVAASNAATPAKAEVSSLENELQQLRDLLEAQAKQIQIQNEQLKAQQQRMQAMEERLRGVNEVPENAATPEAGSNNSALGMNPAAAVAVSNNQDKKPDEPTALRFKGVTLTPGGFMAAETVYRSKATSSDVNTPLNSIPFSGTSPAHLSEFNASGRQSRISMLVEGKLDTVKLRGYYETDFLSSGTTSNNNQSNSYTLRQRQFFGQAAFNSGWGFTGGQMWSLVTETRKGLDNRTEATPLTIDAQYTVGFSWARQYGFRVTKAINDKFFLGFSVEGPQTTFGGRGFNSLTTTSTTNTTVNVGTTAAPIIIPVITTSTVQNFAFGAAGTGGGLFNATANYSFNKTPDFVFKAAWEPGWGHFEAFGIISTFRDRIFPCAVVVAANANNGEVGIPCPVDGTFKSTGNYATNDSRTGGGGGGNLRIPLFDKKLDIGLHALYGDGIGRYGTSGLPDATARNDGTLSLVRGGQALGTLELHPNPKFDIYFNFGAEYAARTSYTGYLTINADGSYKYGAGGYGSPFSNNSGCTTEAAPTSQYVTNSGKCAGDTRAIYEGTVGFWHRIYSGPRGRIQWGMQYSYVERGTWSGNNAYLNTTTAGLSPKAIDNMVFTSFRYYLP